MNEVMLRFQGLSGRLYDFAMRDLPTAANDCCGVYIFGRRYPDGSFKVLYIGRAVRMAMRVTDNHEKVGPAINMGMTTLGQLSCANDAVADVVERDLIANYNPPLNINLRTR